MGDSSWQVLARRVDRLERESRWWKASSEHDAGITGYYCAPRRGAGKKANSPTELRGQRIVLVDKAEQGRAELTMLPDKPAGSDAHG